MRLLAILPAFLLLGAAPEPPRYHYVLDAAKSDISAKVSFFLVTSKTAHFPSATGEITLAPDWPDAVQLDVTLDARALTAPDEVTLKRLKGDKFFDVARYPSVRFSGHHLQMTGARTAKLSGDLTARGITRPVTLDVTFAEPPLQAKGDRPLNLSAKVDINRDDFGMTAYHLIVGKTVTISIDATMVPG